MRISSRRLRWGIICGLALTGAVLLRPVRTVLDQWVMAPMFDPNMSVGELHLHAGKGLVEIRRFDWQSRIGEQRLAMSSNRAWMAIDPEPLIDKRMHIPKFILEDARLQLADATPAMSSDSGRSRGMSRSNVWQDTLKERIQSLDWQEIAREFTTFLSADDQPRTWQERMQRWLARSQQLTASAQTFEQSNTSLTNPLRIETEQQSKLRQLNGILEEQLAVTQQFGSLEQLVSATIRRVEERFQHDVERVDQELEQQVADPELIAELAREILVESSHRAWSELCRYAEVSDYVARARLGKSKANDWNVNVRATESPTLAMPDVSAAGIFHLANRDIPFRMVGAYERCQQLDFKYQDKSMWQVVFDKADKEVTVVVASRPGLAGVNDLQLLSATAAAPSVCRLVIASDAQSIEGEFTLQPEDWSDMLGEESLQAMSLNVAGDWDDVRFEVQGELSEWLLAATRKKIEAELWDTRGKLVLELQSQADARIAQLQRVASELEVHENASIRHGEQIAAVETKVQEHFQQLNAGAAGDVEFARRPAGTLR